MRPLHVCKLKVHNHIMFDMPPLFVVVHLFVQFDTFCLNVFVVKCITTFDVIHYIKGNVWSSFTLQKRLANYVLNNFVRQRLFETLNPLKPSVIIWSHFECSAPYRSNLPFLISDIRALWRSGLSARVPKCQKLKTVG